MTIKGKVGNCAVVVECPAEANINQDVGLLNVRPGVNSYFFCAWFNSPIGKQIVEKYSTGGINPFLGLGNVKKLPYPVIDNAAQDRIGQIVHDKVEQARIAEREAHRLMQLAENTVETLIEKKVDSDA